MKQIGGRGNHREGEAMSTAQIGARVTVDYRPEGIRIEVEFPLDGPSKCAPLTH